MTAAGTTLSSKVAMRIGIDHVAARHNKVGIASKSINLLAPFWLKSPLY
jgi:hypothetical protein